MVYLDDSIMQKGCICSAGSKILENFKAPFDATVISRISETALAEKTERIKLGEFGLACPGQLPVLASMSALLCNDVFGFIRRKAAEQGFCYIRPTYGTVSRYGLIPTASSMDQIGIVCKTPAEAFSFLPLIAGHDEKDGVMFPEKNYNYKTGNTGSQAKEIKTGTFEDYAELGKQVLNILAFAEISNNISRYDGIKFGYRTANYKNLDELYTKTRTEAFGPEAKLAIIMGSLILSEDYYKKYYEKAMKIRRLIKESLALRLKEYNVISIAIDNPAAVLAGHPSLSFLHNGKPVQLVADVKKENDLLTAWEAEYT